MMTSGRCFAMLGPPASGKGTQGRMLAEKLGISYLSTGARLRREIEEGSELGRRAQGFLDANQYVPDSLAIEMVQTWIARHPDGWLVDGFPRSVPQAEALLEFLSQEARSSFQAIHLTVPASELRKRVSTRRECTDCGASTTSDHEVCPKCGSAELEVRADDSTEGLEKRLQAYETLTVPALDFLRSQSEVITVDGIGTREEIAARIADQLP